MKINFKTKEGLLVASCDGEIAKGVFPVMIEKSEQYLIKDKTKKGFKFTEDFVIRISKDRGATEICCWKDSYAVIEN